MKLVTGVAGVAAALALVSTMAAAADSAESAEDPGRLLRLEVVMTRSEGDSVVARLPFSVLLTSGGTRARVYGGIQLPIVVRHEGSNTMMFKNAGGTVSAQAWTLGEGRFKVDLSTEYGGVYPADDETPPRETDPPPDAPVLRSFSSNATITLRDGQSMVFSDSADPITGETVRAEVTLHVVE